ncbi:MAG: hypothetical protein WAT39_19760 [Planctomycetota bacterium]
MNSAPRLLHALAACFVLGATTAQSPVDPPPWWAVNDNVTVSLYWSFDGPAPTTPTLEIVPQWYSQAQTVMLLSNVIQLPGLTGQALGLPAGPPAAGSIDLQVDNDPYPDWIKIFWFQFDAFEGVGSSIVHELEKSLNYDRAILSSQTVSLGGGWEKTTVMAQLIPQPNDEGIDWSFLTTGANAALIDNLFVNSKCVKPGPDNDGDASGDLVGGPLNLSLAAPGVDCRAVAITEGPAPTFQRRYWVSTRASGVGAAHTVLQLNPAGVVISTTPLPVTAALAPAGAMDLAVEVVNVGPLGSVQFVYALVDSRATTGFVDLIAINATTAALAPASQNVRLVGFPAIPTPSTNFGLAFDPSGDLGAGTFWVSDPGSNNVYEFARNGVLRNTESLGGGVTGLVGLGYDDTLGNFYGLSRASLPTPSGPINVHGVEWSGYDSELTGNRFCGNLNLASGGSPGGFAAGLEVYRSRSAPTSQLNLVCLVETPGNPLGVRWLYEIAGPVSFGWSLLGRCHLRDVGPFRGVPFAGSTIEVALSGVPNTVFASLILGFSNTTSAVGPLPLSLSGILGWDESILSVSPDVMSALVPATTPGEFRQQIAIPSTVAGYTPVFFQWLGLDSSVQGFFAMSQAAKTVIYP